MAKAYHLFKDRGEPDPPQGEPVKVHLIDPDTFMEFEAEAILSASEQDLPDSDEVWFYVKGGRGGHAPEERPDNPWRIKIVEEIAPEEAPEAKIKKVRVSLGERGDMIRSLIKERESKNK